MKTGIYAIKNKANGKMYVGQSFDIDHRWSQHTASLLSQKHKNKHLQAAWDLYGSDKFTMIVLCLCLVEELTQKEQNYIDEIGIENLYNTCPSAESRLGARMSDESRLRISIAKKNTPPWNKGKNKNDYPQMKNSGVKNGQEPWNKGVACLEETKQKLSIINTGKSLSLEVKRKISETMKRKGINPHNYYQK